jgi:MATE family multidrug resistance protein
MGRQDEDFFKFVVWTYAKLNLIVGLTLSAFTYFYAQSILEFYTHNDVIVEIARPILYLYAIFSLVDNFNVMFQSVLRGSGNQHIPSIWNIILTCFVTIPVAYLLAFTFDFGVIGLWCGIFIFMSSMLAVSFYYCYNLDFNSNAKKIKDEINGCTS